MSQYTPPPKVIGFLDSDDPILFARLTTAQIERLVERAETVSFSRCDDELRRLVAGAAELGDVLLRTMVVRRAW